MLSRLTRRPNPDRKWRIALGASILLPFIVYCAIVIPIWEKSLEFDLGTARLRNVDRWFLVWAKRTEPRETWVSRFLADELKGVEPQWVACTSNSRTSVWAKIHASCYYRSIPTDLAKLQAVTELYKLAPETYPLIARKWLQHARTDYLVLSRKDYVSAITDEISEAPPGTVFDVAWVNAFHAKFDERPIRER